LKAFKMLMAARTLTKVRFLATTSPLQATTWAVFIQQTS
jgi:hypothetical protein